MAGGSFTLSLSNYSEFGLIVAAVGYRQGWIDSEWLVILALALAMTLVLASPLNAASIAILGRVRRPLERFQRARLHPEERAIDLEGATIAVLGMGRIGAGAYDRLRRERGDVLVGLEFDPDRVQAHRNAGRRVVLADAADPATRDRICGECIEMALLAMPERDANLRTARMLLSSGFGGHLAAVVRFDDEIPAFAELGIESVFNFYAEDLAHARSLLGRAPGYLLGGPTWLQGGRTGADPTFL